MDCRQSRYHQNCGSLCVGKHWFSKITSGHVDAQHICKDQGYDGISNEHGGNHGIQCRYPGNKYGSPNHQGGSKTKLGQWVSWKCSKGKYYE